MRHNHPKRRQHTVAEVYLKGFADERGRVEVAYRHGKHAPSSIRNASVQNFFYTFDDRGKPNAEIEDWMGERVETAATGPLERLRTGLQPQAEDIAALAPFVAVSLMRTESVRSAMEQIDAHLRPFLALMEAAKRNSYSLLELSGCELQELLDGVARRLPPYKADKHSLLRTMLRKTDEVTTTLSGWHWRLDTAENACLLTADTPVVTLSPETQERWHGILPSGSTVLLPVSPRHLLTISPTPLFDDGLVSTELATRVNAMLCRDARLAVYRHPAMTWPKGVTLDRRPPMLAPPRITLSASPPGTPSTSPATYPPVIDPQIATLLGRLQAVNEVE
jgi:hypothetical protein